MSSSKELQAEVGSEYPHSWSEYELDAMASYVLDEELECNKEER